MAGAFTARLAAAVVAILVRPAAVAALAVALPAAAQQQPPGDIRLDRAQVLLPLRPAALALAKLFFFSCFFETGYLQDSR